MSEPQTIDIAAVQQALGQQLLTIIMLQQRIAELEAQLATAGGNGRVGFPEHIGSL